MRRRIGEGQRGTGPSLEDTGPQLPESSPGRVTQDALCSPAAGVTAHVNVVTREARQRRAPGFFLEAGPMGALVWHVPDSQECVQCKSRCLHGRLGTVSHSYLAAVVTVQKPKLPHASRGPALHRGLSEGASLGPVSVLYLRALEPGFEHWGSRALRLGHATS